MQAELALEAGDLDVVEGVARLCDQTVLHALLTACKVDLGGRVGFFKAPAMASAGLICPAVPPAAMRTRMVIPPYKRPACGRAGLRFVLLFCTGCAGRSQVNGLAGKLCFPLGAGGLPLGTHLLPLLRCPLAVASNVHHHAHLCQQQDQAGTAGGEERQADAGVGQGVGDHGDVAEHLHAICAIMPIPTMVQYRFSAL